MPGVVDEDLRALDGLPQARVLGVRGVVDDDHLEGGPLGAVGDRAQAGGRHLGAAVGRDHDREAIGCSKAREADRVEARGRPRPRASGPFVPAARPAARTTAGRLARGACRRRRAGRRACRARAGACSRRPTRACGAGRRRRRRGRPSAPRSRRAARRCGRSSRRPCGAPPRRARGVRSRSDARRAPPARRQRSSVVAASRSVCVASAVVPASPGALASACSARASRARLLPRDRQLEVVERGPRGQLRQRRGGRHGDEVRRRRLVRRAASPRRCGAARTGGRPTGSARVERRDPRPGGRALAEQPHVREARRRAARAAPARSARAGGRGCCTPVASLYMRRSGVERTSSPSGAPARAGYRRARARGRSTCSISSNATTTSNEPAPAPPAPAPTPRGTRGWGPRS